MKRFFTATGLFSCLLCLTYAALGQNKTINPNLADIPAGKGWKVVNRDVTSVEEDGKRAVRFDERAGQGLAWLTGSNFTEGTIEVDIKGKNVLQRSFVGVAFRGVDEKTHDAVYFRPFNFKSEDPVRRIHAVQYVAHPDFPWPRLRKERDGIYEKAVNPVPDPEGWFHARIVVAKRKISVFVNDAKEPSLMVDELTDRQGGWVGLWVGEGSGGAFANLKITPVK